jgi:hypothetical protein
VHRVDGWIFGTVDRMTTTSLPIRYDRWCGWMLGLMGMGRRWSGVTVDDHEVVVRMGWAFQASIPRSAVVSATGDIAAVLGWGVHGWGGRWLVNGSSRGLVRLSMPGGVRARVVGFPVRLRTLRVSVESPDELIALLS